MNFLPGKKTYVVAVGIIIYGVLGFLIGYQDAAEAGRTILEGIVAITLRAGIAGKKEP